MFSRKHTQLTDREKDVVQRTYYNINQILDFLLDPLGKIKKQSKWLQTNLKPTSSTGRDKPNQKGKEA